jgi:hypothetical protein
VVDTTLLIDLTDPQEMMRRTSTSYRTRYIHYFEMVGLLDAAELEIENVLGSYALDPFDDASVQMIFVCHRR